MVHKSLMEGAPIGIIAAMDAELKRYVTSMEGLRMDKICGVPFFVGTIKGRAVVACVCGVGKVNSAFVATLMIAKFGIIGIINTGVAGGIGHKPLDVVVAESAVQYDSDYTALGEPLGQVEGVGVYIPSDQELKTKLMSVLPGAYLGVIASGDRFVSDKDTVRMLKEKFSAQAVDCETASIFHVAFRAGVPVAALRVISDGADEDAAMSFAELKEKASDLAAEAVMKSLKI